MVVPSQLGPSIPDSTQARRDTGTHPPSPHQITPGQFTVTCLNAPTQKVGTQPPLRPAVTANPPKGIDGEEGGWGNHFGSSGEVRHGRPPLKTSVTILAQVGRWWGGDFTAPAKYGCMLPLQAGGSTLSMFLDRRRGESNCSWAYNALQKFSPIASPPVSPMSARVLPGWRMNQG